MSLKLKIREVYKNEFKGFVEVIELQKFNWTRLEQDLFREWEIRSVKSSKTTEFDVECSLYDLVTYGITSPFEFKKELRIVKQTFSFLNIHLKESEKRIIRPTFIKLLKHQNDSWRDFFGELLILCYFKNSNYDLVNCSFQPDSHQSRKDIDYVFKNKDDKKLRIEVLNIKPSSFNKETIQQYINGKIYDKISDKKLEHHEANLAPIIWCNSQDLEFIKTQVLTQLKLPKNCPYLFCLDPSTLTFGRLV